jgi:hypothetical protein
MKLELAYNADTGAEIDAAFEAVCALNPDIRVPRV